MAVATARNYLAASSQFHSITEASAPNLDFNGNVDFYIAGWFRSTLFGADRALVGKWIANTGNRQYLLLYNTALDRFQWDVSSAGTGLTAVTLNTFGSPSVDTWYFIQCYHDATNDLIGASVNNGTFDTASHTTGIFNGTAPFNIAHYIDGGANLRYWSGQIGPVGVWSVIPSGAIQTSLYNAGVGKLWCNLSAGERANCVLYTNMDEATGNALDYSGSGYNLTDNNGVTSAAGIANECGAAASAFPSKMSLMGVG